MRTRGSGTVPVLSHYVAGILMLDPKTTEICFGLWQSTIMMLGGLLGLLLNIYSTKARGRTCFYCALSIRPFKISKNSPAVNAVDSTLSSSLTATMDATGAKLFSLTRRVDIVDSMIWSTPPFKNAHVFSRSAVGGMFAKSLAGAADNEAMMEMKEKVLS